MRTPILGLSSQTTDPDAVYRCASTGDSHASRIDILGTDVTAHIDDRLIAVVIVGRLTGAVALGILEHFYPDVGDRNILWDMSAAKVELTENDLGGIAARAAQLLGPAPQRRTACLVSGPEACVPLWKYVNAAFQAGVRAEYSVFVDAQRARAWLAQD